MHRSAVIFFAPNHLIFRDIDFHSSVYNVICYAFVVSQFIPPARKLCNAGYDVIYPEAPHILPMISTVNIEGQPVEVTNGGRKNARAWFTYNRDDPCDTSESQTGKSVEYIGLDESLGLIGDVIKGCVEADGASSETRKGKIVALLGFSQGGTFAHVLASLAESEGTSSFRRIDGYICIGAFPAKHTPSEKSKYHTFLDRTIGIESLYIIGKNDTSVCPKLSNDLAALFEDSAIHEHEKGHLVPNNSVSCHAIIRFLAALKFLGRN